MSQSTAPASTTPPLPSGGSGFSPYLLFTGGQGVSALGNWMQKTAIGWLSWELTHSTLWVGTIALCDFIAALLITPLAGALTDRSNPYRLLIVTQSLLILLALLLWALLAEGLLTIGLLFVWVLVEAVINGLNQPVRMVAISLLATPGQMSQAIASNSLAANLARIAGPALAGLIMLKGETQQVLLLNALSFLAMIAAVLLVRRHLNRRAASSKEPIHRQMREGFSYIRNTPGIARLLLLVLAFALLARPFTELMPALAGAVFAGGADSLALLMSAQGVGALLGATLLLKKRPPRHLPRLILLASLGIAAALLLLARVPSFSWALPVIAFAGLFHVTCNIGMQTTTQLLSDPAMKGRVMAVYGLLFRSMPSVGAFLLALLSQWLYLPWLLALAGGLFGLLVLVHSKPLLQLERLLP